MNDITNKHFLVVGLGSIGQRHLKNLYQLGVTRLTALTRGRSGLTQELPPFKKTHILEEALAMQPDAVLVCNPTALHLEVALAAARQGCHLFLEKPLSHNLTGLDELEKIASQQNLIAQTGFQFRFHPVLQEIKQLIDSGQLGRIISAQVHWGEYLPNWHPWEDYRQSYSARPDLGGGVLLTLCHPFDYLRWLVGEVEQVYSAGGQLSDLELEVEDTVMTTLTFRSGAIASVYLDYAERPPRHDFHIIGTRGKVFWDNTTGSATIELAPDFEKTTIHPPDDFERNALFLAEIQHFLSCLQNNQTPACNLLDGIRAQQIVMAAKASLESGQAKAV